MPGRAEGGICEPSATRASGLSAGRAVARRRSKHAAPGQHAPLTSRRAHLIDSSCLAAATAVVLRKCGFSWARSVRCDANKRADFRLLALPFLRLGPLFHCLCCCQPLGLTDSAYSCSWRQRVRKAAPATAAARASLSPATGARSRWAALLTGPIAQQQDCEQGQAGGAKRGERLPAGLHTASLREPTATAAPVAQLKVLLASSAST